MTFKDSEQRKAYQKIYSKQYRENHKERMAKQNLEWRLANPDKKYRSKKKRCPIKAKQYYNNNKNARAKQAKIYRREQRQLLEGIKIGYGCCNPDCKWAGEFLPGMLDFHHIVRSEKSFNIGAGTKSLAKVYVEINKCCVLCANCHRQVTWHGLSCEKFERCALNTCDA